nr:type VI secretion system tube protein Hcp [uncultured Roseateles sp.]
MPGNAFIKFTADSGTIPGESLQKGHTGKDGWIEIGDWSWDIEAETSFLKGTGAAVGKPTPGTMSFSHYYDKSSPVIMKMIVQGTHFKTAQIDMCKQTGSGTPEIYFQMVAAEVFITKVSSKGGEDGAVNQDVEMVFKSVKFGYKRQTNDGKLGATVEFAWNIAEMTTDAPKCVLTI